MTIHRKGKTARDHASGSHSRCIRNKQERATWQNDSRRSSFKEVEHTCNGKRNRYANAAQI